MVGQALQFRYDDAQVFGAFRHLYPRQLLHGQAITQVVAHRGNIIQPVGQRDNAGICPFLGQFLDAAVQVADNRLNIKYDLAVEGGSHAVHAVGTRVYRPEVQDKRLGLECHHLGCGH